MVIVAMEQEKMAKKYIEAGEFWNRLISKSENDWVGFDTIDEVLSEMPDIDYEIINDAHNEGYDVGYWAGRRDYEPRWIPVMDGLPKIGDRALVTIPSIGETFVTIGTYAGEYRWHVSDYGFCEKVIAWQPLPSPYKGGEKE